VTHGVDIAMHVDADPRVDVELPGSWQSGPANDAILAADVSVLKAYDTAAANGGKTNERWAFRVAQTPRAGTKHDAYRTGHR